MSFTELLPASSDHLMPVTDQLRLAVTAYLARFMGSSGYHIESDLRCYLAWCAGHGLDPLAARRRNLELYIWWMQEIRRFRPSMVSRRFSVATGFYRTCVIDGLWSTHPPSMSAAVGDAGVANTGVHRPAVRGPAHYGSGVREPVRLRTGRHARPAGLADLRSHRRRHHRSREEHGHRVLRVCGKGTKIVLIPLPPAAERAIDRAIGTRNRGPILLNTRASG